MRCLKWVGSIGEVCSEMSGIETPRPRDPLAVDHEPIDEELEAVMKDVLRVVLEKRVIADTHMRELMANDLRAAEAHMVILLKKINFPRRRLAD